MGDFLGFTFGGVRSSDLGITRVSGGDRYDEQLHPEIKDRTAEVPGLNGEYYFGSDFGPRSFDIEIAYDNLTEQQLKKLRQIFGTKEIKELIFDERPYKKYLAKLEDPIELSFVCFDEPNYTWEKIPLSINEETELMEYAQGISGDFEQKVYDNTTRRIYKGEGKISFICHYPFAKSCYKQIPITEVDSDWVISSGILSAQAYASVDKYAILNPPAEGEEQQEPVLYGFTLYNPGDLATGFRLYLPAATIGSSVNLIYKEDSVNTTASLILNAITLETGDIGVLVDTNSGLIIGVTSMSINQSGNAIYSTSGNLYNKYVNSGYFFKIEPNIIYDRSVLQIDGGSSDNIKIFYDYLYF